MLLAIDIGNSQIALGLYERESWVTGLRLSTEVRKTSDEYSAQIHGLLLQHEIDRQSIRGVAISSVVPELTTPFCTLSRQLFSVEPFVISKQSDTGLDQSSIPREIGSDLLCNAAEAHRLYPGKDCMVIDFGTALTFTTVSGAGEILGVAIAPGAGSAAAALSSGTAQLPHVEIAVPESVLGLDTVSSIQAGIVYGYIGLVGSVIERTEQEVGRPLTVIATGGFSRVIAPHVRRIDTINPNHTLEGLINLYERELSIRSDHPQL